MDTKNPLDISTMVYDVVKMVPKGRVTTYGAIAKCIGSAKSARIVGWLLNKCHDNPEIPAHRVVNRTGALTGFAHFATPTLMQELLESEGVAVKDMQVVEFKTLFWDPMTMLDQL